MPELSSALFSEWTRTISHIPVDNDAAPWAANILDLWGGCPLDAARPARVAGPHVRSPFVRLWGDKSSHSSLSGIDQQAASEVRFSFSPQRDLHVL